MDTSILSIAEHAAAAAIRAHASNTPEENPFQPETEEHQEWGRRYHIALLRVSAPPSDERGA